MQPEIPASPRIKAYAADLQSLLAAVEPEMLDRVFARLRRARDEGATVFIAGNGGSAAIAMHFANDLGKATKRSGRSPIRVMSLCDNVSWVTALANDEGYERVFSGQLENFARPGDVLMVISSSGNSPNIVAAVKLAKQRGVTTIGFVGFDGGAVRMAADLCLWIRSEKGAYELVEDGHMALCHILTMALAADRAGQERPSA